MNGLQLRILLPLGFFILLSYIIFLANTADYNIGFALVQTIPYGDKLMHALLFGTMAMLLNYGFNYKSVANVQLGAVLVLSCAVLEECSQLFIETRTFDTGDLLADLVGVVLFSYIQLTYRESK